MEYRFHNILDAKIFFDEIIPDSTLKDNAVVLRGRDRSGKSRLFAAATALVNESFSELSSSRQQIAFDSQEKSSATRDVYVVNAQGGSPRLLTPVGDHDYMVPSWSKDGKWIYFSSNKSGDWQVWKVRATGGDLVQVTKQGGYIAFEAPDGKAIYYGKGVTTPGIWKVPVDGGDEVPVLELNKVAGFWCNWAVANQGIYYIKPEPKSGMAIEFFSFATRKKSTVALLGKVHVEWFGFGVSPDEKQAMYTLVDQEGSDIMLVENFQ